MYDYSILIPAKIINEWKLSLAENFMILIPAVFSIQNDKNINLFVSLRATFRRSFWITTHNEFLFVLKIKF